MHNSPGDIYMGNANYEPNFWFAYERDTSKWEACSHRPGQLAETKRFARI